MIDWLRGDENYARWDEDYEVYKESQNTWKTVIVDLVNNHEIAREKGKIDSDEIIDYHVSGDKIEVVDIPTGYTHNIINEGDTDLVTFMWCNECFNPEKPDTYFLTVNEEK